MECWGMSADRQHWERFEQDALHDAGKGKMSKSGVARHYHNKEMRLDIHDLVIGLSMNHVEFGCAV